MLNPKVVTVKDKAGVEHQYTISEPPATAARWFLLQYPISNMTRAQDFAVSQETMVKLMAYVHKEVGGEMLALKTQALIDNHVPDAVTLFKLEALMLDHMTGFFALVRNPDFIGGLVSKIPPSIMPMLTNFLQSLSAKNSPPSQS
jgi:hypothetical protein